MLINIINNTIVITEVDKALSTVVQSQLAFWKFQYNQNDNGYSSVLDQQLFLKVTRFLEKFGQDFKLNTEAKKYSEDIKVTTLNFENLKRIGGNYKNGDFDLVDFDNFKMFVNTNIKRTLKIHQLKAAYHLYLLKNAANFSVPGSGKTTVVLSVYEKLRLEGKVNTLFVVGPPSSFGPWKNEFFETLGRKPKSTVLAGGNRTTRKNHYYDIPGEKKELYLTSFHTLLSDQKEVTDFLKQKHVKAFFIVDEAHYMKQLNGNWAKAILKQSEKAEFRCVLTGTPMPRSYTDIYNLFDFLWPKESPISSENKILIKQHEELQENNSAKHILKENVGSLFYRVRKSELNLKSQNFFSPEIVIMGKYEKQIYDAIYTKIKNYAKEDYHKNVDFITTLAKGRIMRLRQAVSYPKLLTNAIDNYDERLLDDLKNLKTIIRQYDNLEVPSKIKLLLKKVKLFQKKKQKVVIWSNFIGTINLIEKHLAQEGYLCKKIYGATPVEGDLTRSEQTRERIRDEFVDPKSGLNILIANPAACAESISLHKTCHNAIYYDLSYNCSQYLQSLDRIHRVGGSENVEANYYFLQYKESIDTDIKHNLDVKTKKMLEIIDEDYVIYSLDLDETDGDSEAYKRLFFKK